jgi:hypothetical protein
MEPSITLNKYYINTNSFLVQRERSTEIIIALLFTYNNELA